MTYCATNNFYDEICALIKKLSDRSSLTKDENQRLVELLDEWDDTECPETGCHANFCPFAKPIDWVEFHGYTCLFALIEQLDRSKKITDIPQSSGIDPLKAHWALRRGHYNP